MAATRLTDVIVPDVWNPWMIERTAELSEVFQSGIVAPVPELNRFDAGGNTINMPFWQDLSGADEVLSATGTPLTVNPITSEQDIAVVLARGKAWGTNELAAHLSGGDPAGAIADLVAGYWARRFQSALIAILTGVFESLGDESPAPINVFDISEESSGAAVIDSDAMLDAQQLLGDAKGRLTAVCMHSAVENHLAKQGIIDYIQPQEGSPRIPVYQDKRVIVDDSCPVESVSPYGNVYDTYLFGPGAIGYAEGVNTKVTPVETDRVALAGEDTLITRRHFILHPRGVAYTGAATGGGPTNGTLETGSNWGRVYEAKNVRMVLLRHRIS
jgi:hypothetical protein